jgi:hypothetical protein
MPLSKVLLPAAAFLAAFTVNALGEMKDWRSAQHGFHLSYNTDVWTATAPERLDPRQPMVFIATNVDRTVTIAVRVTPTQGEQMGDALLKKFTDGFARGAERAGKKNTLEWTQTDFATEAGCMFRAHYEEPNPNAFMIGRLVLRNGNLYQIVAVSKVASEEFRAEAERVLRSFTFQ